MEIVHQKGAADRAIVTRHQAASGNLCLLVTLRSDGFPRISPMEPRVFQDQLWLVAVPNTTKFKDLSRDPHFCLHCDDRRTGQRRRRKAVSLVYDVRDKALHQRFAMALLDETGFDLSGQEFDHFYVADLTGASAVELGGCHLDVTIWKPGEPERVVRKH